MVRQRKFCFWILILSILCSSVTCYAQRLNENKKNTSAAAQLHTNLKTQKTSLLNWETGISLGTPSGANLVLGLWGSTDMPLLLRASGMLLGDFASGAEAQVGWIFDTTGDFKQYLAAGYSFTEIKMSQDERFKMSGLGPFYGFNWNGFTTLFGVIFGSATKFRLNGTTTAEVSPPFVRFSLGYSVFW